MNRITYTLQEDDFMAYARYHFAHSDDARASRNRTIIIGLVAMGVYAFGVKDMPDAIVRCIGTFVTMGALFTFYFKVVRPYLMRGWLKSGARRMIGETTLELSDDATHVSNAHGKGRLKWSDCHGVVEDGEYYYILMGPLRAFVVPKRAFKDAAAAAAFYETARGYYRAAHPGKVEKA